MIRVSRASSLAHAAWPAVITAAVPNSAPIPVRRFRMRIMALEPKLCSIVRCNGKNCCTNRRGMHGPPLVRTNGAVDARIAEELLTQSRIKPETEAGLLRCKMPAVQRRVRIRAGERGHPRPEPRDPAPADRHGIIVRGVHLDQFVVAGPLVADHAIDVDDVAAMNAHEAVFVEPRFDVADGERTKQLVVTVEDISVMRVGVNGDDILHRKEMRRAVALDRKVTRKAPRRRGG